MALRPFNYVTGKTIYGFFFNLAGQVWNTATPGFETPVNANRANYVVAAAETGLATEYTITIPAAIPAGKVYIHLLLQAGGSPAASDALIGSDEFDWTGTAVVGQTGDNFAFLSAHLPGRLAKNVAFSNFEFVMVQSADHVTPATGLTVTAQRSIDGAAFAACANAVSEVGSGTYKIDLAASDLNGNIVTLRFTATGADTRLVTVITQL
jgi:hypothetical protein